MNKKTVEIALNGNSISPYRYGFRCRFTRDGKRYTVYGKTEYECVIKKAQLIKGIDGEDIKKTKKNKFAYVYFIGEEGTDFLKIGITESDVIKRLLGLQVGNPRKLVVLKTITTSAYDAPLFEKVLHSLFDNNRVTNNYESEWFRNAEEIMNKVEFIKPDDIPSLIRIYGVPVMDEIRQKWFDALTDRKAAGI